MSDDELIAAVMVALSELRRLRSSDPEAGRANETVRLTAHTLECFWLRELASGTEPTPRSP